MIVPSPPNVPVLDQAKRYFHAEWVKFLNRLSSAINLKAERVALSEFVAQDAALPDTEIPVQRLLVSDLRVRVSIYARVTQAATVSSSLSVTLSWEDGGVPCSETFGPNTGNTTASVISAVRMINADKDSLIEVSTAYASSGATAMAYSLDVLVEEIL